MQASASNARRASAATWPSGSGGRVAEIYCDNDLSAFSGRRRPDYERLLTDIERPVSSAQSSPGTPTGCTAAHGELERYITACDKHGIDDPDGDGRDVGPVTAAAR